MYIHIHTQMYELCSYFKNCYYLQYLSAFIFSRRSNNASCNDPASFAWSKALVSSLDSFKPCWKL